MKKDLVSRNLLTACYERKEIKSPITIIGFPSIPTTECEWQLFFLQSFFSSIKREFSKLSKVIMILTTIFLFTAKLSHIISLKMREWIHVCRCKIKNMSTRIGSRHPCREWATWLACRDEQTQLKNFKNTWDLHCTSQGWDWIHYSWSWVIKECPQHICSLAQRWYDQDLSLQPM